MEKEEVLDFEEKPKKKKKLKPWLKVLIMILTFLIIIIVLMFALYDYMLQPVSTKSEKVEFTIEEGDSVYGVGSKLESEGLIRSYFAYKIYVKLNKVTGYKAGIYEIDKKSSTKEIVAELMGRSYKNGGNLITFKEGKNIRNVAETIAKNTKVTQEEFYDKLNDQVYIEKLINKYWFLTEDITNSDIYYPLEGYLFPETYSFGKDDTVEKIIEKMLDQTDKVFSKYKDLFESSKYSIHEIATLSSLIENEGVYSEDRKLISSVFYNRLNSNMSLGSDVTTYYAFKIDMGERDLTRAEINTYNPYNTRGPKMSGKFPVGPISNFSEDSLKAALIPSSSDYYYFVADKSGKTHFSKTYDEHQEIIKELKESGNWFEW